MKTISRHLTTGALALAGTAATIGFGGIAQAAHLNAMMGFVPFGNATYMGGGGTPGTAMMVDFPSINVVNTIPETYQPPGLQAPNAFLSGPFAVNLLSPVTLSPDPLPLTLGTSFSVSFTTASGPAVFNGTLNYRSNVPGNVLDLFFLGNITVGGFHPSPASLSLNFFGGTSGGGINFTGVSGGEINYSATLSSPPAATGVPEPSTVLAVLAVAGAGAFSRRRKS